MKTLGFFLVAAGASSYVLHALGWQSLIMGSFGEHEKYAAPAAIALGAVILLLGFKKKKDENK